jgi:hypothetical protein
MDSGMIAKIEKAMLYSQEPGRISFDQFQATFDGDHTKHQVVYKDGKWQCDCTFFKARGVCSHIMAMERVLVSTVKPAEAMPMPA